LSQSKPSNGKIGGRLIALAILGTLAIILFASHQLTSTQLVEAQARRPQRKTPPRGATQTRKPLLDSSFKHETHRAPKTKLNCSNCHTISAREAPDEIAAATKSTLKGFPYHDSCLECHRRTSPRFFSGAAPTICTVCHTLSSPRLSARDVSKFPKQSDEVIEVEFPGYYPHDHRDHGNLNCATCHVTDERAYAAIPVGESETFKPPAGTFKTSPSGHAACFECHWAKKPNKDDCAGCHLTPDAVAKRKPELISTGLADWFKSWPREWARRINIKFNHKLKQHPEECGRCHDITKLQTLDIPRAEVPIGACAKCHLTRGVPANLGVEMIQEYKDIEEGRDNNPLSKTGTNSCTGCHAAVIGSLPPPCSHYLAYDETYFDEEDFPKSAAPIAQRCKK